MEDQLSRRLAALRN
nr:Chain F, CHARGED MULTIVESICULAR BODY PROTEIN 1A [Homo sapiens]2YMB_H Chain H, CHARGED MULTIVESICULAR BODY PROTEIN 1A [Homo sapiens]